jgi:hypothetical protein
LAVATDESATLTAFGSAAAGAVATKAARTLFARSRFVHRERPTSLIGLIQASNCPDRGIVIGHFHESKAFASTRVPVENDLGGFY